MKLSLNSILPFYLSNTKLAILKRLSVAFSPIAENWQTVFSPVFNEIRSFSYISSGLASSLTL
jgi:hypothetical protein